MTAMMSFIKTTSSSLKRCVPTILCKRRSSIITTTTRFFSSSTTTTKNKKKPPLCIVDLRGTGWSLLERLIVEEFLGEKTKSQQSWLVIGTHEATEHRHLNLSQQKAPVYIEKSLQAMDDYNPSCAIVVEKVEELNIPQIQRDGILCLEGRSFVGESVVVDHSSLLTTLLLNTTTPEAEKATAEFMTQQFWKPTFELLEKHRLEESSPSTRGTRAPSPLTMVLDTKSCSKGDNSGRLISLEDLGIIEEEEEEEDTATTTTSSTTPLPLSLKAPNNLVLGEFSIGRIHAEEATNSVRSIFWWDYEDEDHLSYLDNANKSSRDDDRIWKLQDCYPNQQPKLMELLQSVCKAHYEVTQMNPRDISRLMAQEKTGLQEWWDTKRSSWKIVQQF